MQVTLGCPEMSWDRCKLHLAVLGQMQVTPGCPRTNASYTWLSWDKCKLHLAVLGQMQVTPGCPGTNASYTWLSWHRCKLHLTLFRSTAASVSHFPAHALFSGSRETDEAFGVMKKPNFCFSSSSLAQVIDLCQQSTVSPAGAQPVVGASKARLQQQTS